VITSRIALSCLQRKPSGINLQAGSQVHYLQAGRISEHYLDAQRWQRRGQTIMTGMVYYITPDYFGALQIPLLMGRPFTDADCPESQRVAIVNQTFARKFFHGTSPIGRYLDKDTMIVGMVADVAIATGLEASTQCSGRARRAGSGRRQHVSWRRNARDRHSHRSGLHHSSSRGPYRSGGSTSPVLERSGHPTRRRTKFLGWLKTILEGQRPPS
jgi:hypothetical protein